VGALTDWAKPTAGNSSVLCIKTDGTLWSWGSNNGGTLGIGNNTSRSSPVQVGSNTNWATVDNSPRQGGSVLATTTDGKLFAWGYNNSGACGLGNTASRNSPVQVGALTDWKTPSCGIYIGLCVKTDGTLWTWGYNNVGQLGQNNTISRSSPVQIGSDTNWATPAAGANQSACVKTDGTLWTWGNNYAGNLGLGDTVNRSSPVQVGALTNWSIPEFGNCCLKTDGTLWTWGSNSSGQLGQNNTINRSSPVQVGALATWILNPSKGGAVGCIQS